MKAAIERRIMVVDDDESVRLALARTLTPMGYKVITAGGGQEALGLLHVQSVDLVISDYLMPEMTGLELMQRLRDRFPEVMRIILTAHAETDVAIQAINSGEIYRFLTKPWDSAELSVLLHIAFEQLELERENRRLLSMVRYQSSLLRNLRRLHPDAFGGVDSRRLEAVMAD